MDFSNSKESLLSSWFSLKRIDSVGKTSTSRKNSNTEDGSSGTTSTTPMIVVGVIAPPAEQSYLEEMCRKLRRIAPDRIEVIPLTSDIGGDNTKEHAAIAVHVLVLCASRPNFPQELAQQ
jgi:hypothetical protein